MPRRKGDMVTDPLADRFEADRPHLRAVAYRMLGSLSDAEDAVQEAWIRLQRSDVDGVANLTGWLTTVVGRVCLDMLRSRTSRREDQVPDPVVVADEGADPEQEAVLADSVGLALLVVLDTLGPAERVAFVLHDLVGLLDPDVVLRADAGRGGVLVRGAAEVAGRALLFAKFTRDDIERVLVNGVAGLLARKNGRPSSLLAVTVVDGRIVEIDVLADAERLARLVH